MESHYKRRDWGRGGHWAGPGSLFRVQRRWGWIFRYGQAHTPLVSKVVEHNWRPKHCCPQQCLADGPFLPVKTNIKLGLALVSFLKKQTLSCAILTLFSNTSLLQLTWSASVIEPEDIGEDNSQHGHIISVKVVILKWLEASPGGAHPIKMHSKQKNPNLLLTTCDIKETLSGLHVRSGRHATRPCINDKLCPCIAHNNQARCLSRDSLLIAPEHSSSQWQASKSCYGTGLPRWQTSLALWQSRCSNIIPADFFHHPSNYRTGCILKQDLFVCLSFLFFTTMWCQQWTGVTAVMVCHYRQGGDLQTHTLVTYVPILAAQVILEPWIRKATVEYFSSLCALLSSSY